MELRQGNTTARTVYTDWADTFTVVIFVNAVGRRTAVVPVREALQYGSDHPAEHPSFVRDNDGRESYAGGRWDSLTGALVYIGIGANEDTMLARSFPGEVGR